jgi:hypothetical protein
MVSYYNRRRVLDKCTICYFTDSRWFQCFNPLLGYQYIFVLNRNANTLDPSEEIRRISLEGICPICSQKFTNIEEHVSKAHAGGLDVGFVKWGIDKDLEKIKRVEIFRGIF